MSVEGLLTRIVGGERQSCDCLLDGERVLGAMFFCRALTVTGRPQLLSG